MEKLGFAVLGLVTLVLCLAFFFGVVGGLVYICSIAFNFEFSWMLVLGICALAVLLKFLFK